MNNLKLSVPTFYQFFSEYAFSDFEKKYFLKDLTNKLEIFSVYCFQSLFLDEHRTFLYV